jgi:ankyrin repeat protein
MADDKLGVELLLRVGNNPNQREPSLNATALHYASRSGHEGIVRALIDRRADVNARDVNECTPLHWAAKGGHVAVIRLLVESKAQVDAQDSRGCTALYFAAERGHRDAVQLLEESGADPLAKNEEGKTPSELLPPEGG